MHFSGKGIKSFSYKKGIYYTLVTGLFLTFCFDALLYFPFSQVSALLKAL